MGWLERVELSKKILDNIYASPIFGYGPAKEDFKWISNIDNEYTQIAFRFGLMGLIGTVGFVFSLASPRKKTHDMIFPLQKSMRKFSIVLLGMAALFAYTAGSYGTFQIMFVLIIIWQTLFSLGASNRASYLECSGFDVEGRSA